MRGRYLVIGLVVVLAAVTGVLIYQGNQSQTTGSASVVVTQTVTGAEATPSDTYGRDNADATETTAVATGDRPPTNVPMTKLAPGDKAPQFIIFSFDGAGSHQRWNEFMAAAEETNSRFTGFLSGIYLLGDSAKDAGAYTGPGHATGKSSIGYGGPESEIVTEVNDLNLAYSKGHEIGTHYNGHFCDDNPPGGNQWNIAAWKKYNLTYDSSMPAPYTGIAWPENVDGIWEFYMPTVYSPGFESTTMAMDYNFWFKFNQGREEPETAPELRDI